MAASAVRQPSACTAPAHQLAKRLRRVVATGINNLINSIADVAYDPEMALRFARDVMPQLDCHVRSIRQTLNFEWVS